MITRKELVAKYKIAVKRVNELENKKYEYKTNRPCAPFGNVKNMNIPDIIRAGANVHDSDANVTERITQYGILPEDLKNANDHLYEGFAISTWDHDFKLRVEQIHDEKKLKTYKEVMNKLSANFTDEDRFMIEMGEIDTLDIDLDDDAPSDEVKSEE